MKFAIMQHSYEVKFGLHKMWGGLPISPILWCFYGMIRPTLTLERTPWIATACYTCLEHN